LATIDFYYSIGSRYSYLAATQMPALERLGHVIEWRPLDSRALVARRGRDPFAGDPISGQYEWTYRKRDAERWARYYGVPFVDARGRIEFDSAQVALAAVAAARLGRAQSYSLELFAAMFREEEVRTIDRAECVRRAVKCGLDASAFEHALDEPATAEAHSQAVDSALAAGVFGVPTFIIDGELFWGNDRVVLLNDHLQQR
jgi:2-hydroxychromene-2-carboxylate isomerase